MSVEGLLLVGFVFTKDFDFAGLASVKQKRLVKRTHSVYLSCGYGLATASGPEVCFFKELDLSKTCILLN